MTEDITAANRMLLRRFYREVYADWNMTLVDEVVSPRFTSHDWPADSPAGPDAFRDYYAELRSAVPDARYEVDDLVADGDRVAVRWTLRGTHEGDFRGMPPTGRAITLEGIAIYRVERGKLVERWVVSDVYGMMERAAASAMSADVSSVVSA